MWVALAEVVVLFATICVLVWVSTREKGARSAWQSPETTSTSTPVVVGSRPWVNFDEHGAVVSVRVPQMNHFGHSQFRLTGPVDIEESPSTHRRRRRRSHSRSRVRDHTDRTGPPPPPPETTPVPPGIPAPSPWRPPVKKDPPASPGPSGSSSESEEL